MKECFDPSSELINKTVMKNKIMSYSMFYVTSLLLLLSCQSHSPQESQIEKRIQKDLETAPIGNSLELDLPDLPKMKYSVDKDHSSISFRTKHWEIVDLIGWFADFNIIMYSDKEDFTDAVIYAEVFPNSIFMPNEKMMGSAQKSPYLDSENYSKMTFTSSQMKKMDAENYALTGMLKVNGISQQTTFNVKSNGFAYPGEKSICGFDVTGQINRHDFKIAGNAKLHSGKKMHDDIIYLHFALRME